MSHYAKDRQNLEAAKTHGGNVLHLICPPPVLSAQINTPDERSVAQRTSYSTDGIVARRTCVACEEDPLPAISPPAGKDSAIGENDLSRGARQISRTP